MPSRTASAAAAAGGNPNAAAAAAAAANSQAILAAAQSAVFFQQQQQSGECRILDSGSFRSSRQCALFSASGNSNSEFQPDRPIGYGAFGVVWSVTDPRDGKRVALKKLPNVFQSLVSSKRVFRELRMMRFFKHENVLSCLDILQVMEAFQRSKVKDHRLCRLQLNGERRKRDSDAFVAAAPT